MGKLHNALQKVFDALDPVIDLVDELKGSEDEDTADAASEIYDLLYDDILDPLNDVDKIAKEADL